MVVKSQMPFINELNFKKSICLGDIRKMLLSSNASVCIRQSMEPFLSRAVCFSGLANFSPWVHISEGCCMLLIVHLLFGQTEMSKRKQMLFVVAVQQTTFHTSSSRLISIEIWPGDTVRFGIKPLLRRSQAFGALENWPGCPCWHRSGSRLREEGSLYHWHLLLGGFYRISYLN